MRPMDIVAEEELERVSAMLQRDNLVRGLGLVDAVYRYLVFISVVTSVLAKPNVRQNQGEKYWACFLIIWVTD